MTYFGDFQGKVSLRGLAGKRPDLPMTAAGQEAAARGVLSAEAFRLRTGEGPGSLYPSG